MGLARTATRNAAAAALAASLIGAALVVVPASPASAAAPAPVILNGGGQNTGNAQWLETQAQPDDGGASVKQLWMTFLVQHAAGRTINQVGVTAPGVSGAVGVTGQTYVASAGGIETSRVTVAVGIGKPGGFSCPFFSSATRSVDAEVSARVIDSTGESSTTFVGTVKFVEDANCGTRQDFPHLTSTSQNVSEVAPGQNVTYSFTCHDPDVDVISSNDDCDRANIRWRRLDDGATTTPALKTGLNDNTLSSHAISFPTQGYYVVEAQLGNANGNFPNLAGPSQGWWRLGNAVVNDAASSMSGALSFGSAQPSDPPSVNAGASVTAHATVADAGGAVQVIEWDADGDAAFERREHTVPAVSGGAIVHPGLTAGELTQAVSTSTAGVKTVTARITDNGALDAADNVRRQLTFSGQLRVNALPSASNVNVTTDEDTAVKVTMVGSDPDEQPAPLGYGIVSAPPASAGTLGAVSGNEVTFTPAPNFNGSTSFTYRVQDGPAPNNGAFGTSNTATASIFVAPVNDLPTVDAQSVTTDEDTPVQIQVTGQDVEGPLTWSVAGQPDHGTVSCHSSSGMCTYTPAANFFGDDAFIVRGTDTNGATATATISITVRPVNDAPVALAQSVTLDEDSGNVPITLAATDVDDTELTFTAPVDDANHGTLVCGGSDCTYTPELNYNGPDAFTFSVSDGELSSTATVSITVLPVNDAPVATDVPDAVTDEDAALDVTLGGTDVDGDPVTVTSVGAPSHGTATLGAANTAQYAPDANFNGIDAFDFTVGDGHDASDIGTVTVTVRPVNDAPVVADQAFDGAEDTPLGISIAAGDVDGDPIAWSIVSSPGHGQLSGTGPDVIYSPEANFHGADSFVVQVSDGNGGTDTATITLTVASVNDAPQAAATSAETDEEVAVAVPLVASDVDGDEITFSIVGVPAHGTVVVDGDIATYAPDADFEGTDVFVYRATDPAGAFTDATATVVVHPAPLIPTTLEATGAVAHVALAPTVAPSVLRLAATLRDVDGAALAGRALEFHIGDRLACSATTDADGSGTCSTTQDAIDAAVNRGYRVMFAGGPDHAASDATGPVLGVSGP